MGPCWVPVPHSVFPEWIPLAGVVLWLALAVADWILHDLFFLGGDWGYDFVLSISAPGQ